MKNKEQQIIIEEVARIALEDRDYRRYLAHELTLSEAEMENAYQHLCNLVRKEGGKP